MRKRSPPAPAARPCRVTIRLVDAPADHPWAEAGEILRAIGRRALNQEKSRA